MEDKTLKNLIYEDITKYDGIKIEAIHIPENIKFKNDEYFMRLGQKYFKTKKSITHISQEEKKLP